MVLEPNNQVEVERKEHWGGSTGGDEGEGGQKSRRGRSELCWIKSNNFKWKAPE